MEGGKVGGKVKLLLLKVVRWAIVVGAFIPVDRPR